MIPNKRPELRIAGEPTVSTTGSSGSGNRKSGRLTKTVENLYFSPGPRPPRIVTRQKVSSVPKTLMNT